MTVVVEVLVVEDCPQEDAALRLVAMTAQAIGVKPRVMLREVLDLAQAARLGFVGSPTIRIDGSDVAPPDEGQAASLGCRRYTTDHGVQGVPDPGQLLVALRRAEHREPTAS